ncbi:MAG: hypothetical protein IIX75_03450 [Clostridia bacterium]|nr:hypothetical protein [Clostridia bacterium]
MVKINIRYDDVNDDVDIVAIPAEIINILDEIVHAFLEWLPSAPLNDSDYWVFIGEKRVSNCETEGFVKWLNNNYCTDDKKAFIVCQHTNYQPEYKSIEF